MREKLGLGKKVILFSNRKLEPLYNVDRIISMFAQFKNVISDSVLIIAGDGSQKNTLVNLAERLNLEQSIIFSQKKKKGLWRLAPVFLGCESFDCRTNNQCDCNK